MFFARKRSVSSKCFLCESAASATSVFVRKRSANVASATSVFCAKAQRQQQDVGHKGVITGRDGFSLRSLRCSLRGSSVRCP
ncbi:hypothetical protein [Lysinibacillus sphaericus]|uniref:hypothetical protein n=1 Tax=Lysinibacillus sphaericus TaxID=1421 RepID=UPI001CBCCD76|nr:hypothetical protein [Lysinibacillus sphaericus]